MRRFRQLLAVVTCATFALLLVFPLCLYWLGLSGVEGRPEKPRQLASIEQQSMIWMRARGTGTPFVSADDSYTYLASIFFVQSKRAQPDRLVTWWVARDYLATHKRHNGMGWWHLSGAALTIWLSRNWTAEEILSGAVQLQKSD